MIAQAQITNKILGLTLGVSSKALVKQIISDYKLTAKVQGSDVIGCTAPNTFEFGGFNWTSIVFTFYKGKLCAVTFLNDKSPASGEAFDSLKITLYDKYSNYLTRNDSYSNGNKWIEYDDGKTTLSLSYDFRNYRHNVGLLYCDRALFDMKTESDKSEL